MKPNKQVLSEILVDPVSLTQLPNEILEEGLNTHFNLRAGGTSNKNNKELSHFLKTFKPIDPALKSYARKIGSLPKPATDDSTIILDIEYDNSRYRMWAI